MFCRWPTPVRFLSFAVHLHGVENLIAVEYLSEIFRCDAFAGIGYLQNKTFVFRVQCYADVPLVGCVLESVGYEVSGYFVEAAQVGVPCQFGGYVKAVVHFSVFRHVTEGFGDVP